MRHYWSSTYLMASAFGAVMAIFWRGLLRTVLPKLVIWGATILGQQLLIKYIHQHILKDHHD